MLSLLLTALDFIWPYVAVVVGIAVCCFCWFDNETSWGGIRKP